MLADSPHADVAEWLKIVLSLGLPAFGWAVTEASLAWMAAAEGTSRPQDAQADPNG